MEIKTFIAPFKHKHLDDRDHRAFSWSSYRNRTTRLPKTLFLLRVHPSGITSKFCKIKTLFIYNFMSITEFKCFCKQATANYCTFHFLETILTELEDSIYMVWLINVTMSMNDKTKYVYMSVLIKWFSCSLELRSTHFFRSMFAGRNWFLHILN